MEIKRIVEAILFAANKPMTVKQVQQVFPELEQPDLQEIQSAIDAIVDDYSLLAVELRRVASGYRFQVKSELSYWVARLFEEKPPKYSRALLETLAIIAYRQPVTRGDIEDIRGVAVSSNIIRTLVEREWVRIVAHKEVPGRPALYGTTKQFLDYFDLSSLHELPTLQEIKDLDLSVASNQQPMQVNSEQQATSEQQNFEENAEPESDNA
ncbi:MAG: SMC-Scp complex subunit ScpB [Gammaproteobacteria bacterium]